MQSCDDLKNLRDDVDAYSQRIFDHSSRLAEMSNIVVSVPRTGRVMEVVYGHLRFTTP